MAILLVLLSLLPPILVADHGARNSHNEIAQVSSEVYAEIVDINDHKAVITWAKDICRGVSVEEAAKYFNTEATMDALIERYTDGLPDGTRQEVAQICEAELRK